MERFYRTATFAVWLLVAVVCIVYSVILANPQAKLILPNLQNRAETPMASGQPGQTGLAVRSTTSATRPAATLASQAPVRPSPLPGSAYFYRPVLQSCSHAQGITIKGTVWIGTDPQEGVRVRVSTRPEKAAVVAQDATVARPDGSLTYQIVLKRAGSFGPVPATWFVWTADRNGDPSSDPGFSIQTNNLPPDNPSACWSPIIDFAN